MASGDVLANFHPLNNEPPASNYATRISRNQHILLAFDDTVDEAAVFKDVFSQFYTGVGGLTVKVHFSMTSAIINEVIWEAAIERIGVGQQDIDSDGFAATQNSGAVTVPGTSGDVAIATITFTDGGEMDGLITGELYRFKLNRNADDAGDDASGDAELHFVVVEET